MWRPAVDSPLRRAQRLPPTAAGRLVQRPRYESGYGGQVASRITELVLDARDPDLLARFWCEVLGYVELERDEASIEIGPPGVGFGGPQPTIVLNRTDDARGGKLPLHIDVNATDRDQSEELQRLL